jgi:thiamine biosynthesis lipoprotein
VEATRRVYLMGTVCTMTAYGRERAPALAEIERSIAMLERCEAELSTWRADSLLGRLNSERVGVPFPAGRPLARLMDELRCWQRETGSAFDPGIGRLLDAWGVHGAGRIPGARELAAALERSGIRAFAVDPGGGTITRLAAATIDSGGFGKGEALDRALRSRPAEAGPWLIDLGGQVTASGPPPGRDAWTIDLAHPRDRTRRLLTLALASGSLSSSGGSERDRRVEGRRVGHIFDPRTGQPAAFDGSVTVWDPSGLAADVLSTALYVMGVETGIAWAEARGVAACFAVPSGDRVVIRATRPFTARFGRVSLAPPIAPR